MIYNAEEVNYWQTSRSGSEQWINKAKEEIKAIGGVIVGSGSFSDDLNGKAGFMLAFSIDGNNFTIKWPVLQSKTNKHTAAQIQAATALYHEVKAACVKEKFLGARASFIAYLMLPDGRTTSEVNNEELYLQLPPMLSKNLLTKKD